MRTPTLFALLLTVLEFAYPQDGLLDTSFSPPAGYVPISFITGSATYYNYGTAILIEQDTHFVAVAYSSPNRLQNKFSVARFNRIQYDTTFGFMGQVTTAIRGYDDYAHSAALQVDERIVVAGSSSDGSYSDFAVVRYTTDGDLDLTFSDDGMVTTPLGSGKDDAGRSVAIQKDGKIVVGGYSVVGTYYDFALVRYNTDGSLDTTFSGDGIVTTPFGSQNDKAYGVTIQEDGKIVLAGYTSNGANDDIAVARYNTDGNLDTSFSGDGKVTTAIGSSIDHGWSVAIQPDQKIVVAGECFVNSTMDFAVVRYNPDGSLDNTFDGDGKVTTPVGLGSDMAYAVKLQDDDKIVVAGYSYVGSTGNFAVVRYSTDGSLDTTFSNDGKVTTEVGDGGATAIAIQADGKIVIAGSSSYGSTNSLCTVIRYMGSKGIVSVEEGESQPAAFGLEQNYPNPFNPTTVVRYQVPGTSDVRLVVYDMLGREVAVLVDEQKAPGRYEVQFDASQLASGVYVYRLQASPIEGGQARQTDVGQARQTDGGQAGRYVQSRKLILLR